MNFYTQLFLKTNEGLDILQMCICDFLRLSADISLNPLTIFAESSILDAWLGFWICLWLRPTISRKKWNIIVKI